MLTIAHCLYYSCKNCSCSYWFINVITTNICYPRFIMIIFNQIKVCIVMKLGTKLIFIYIVLT